MTPRYGNRAQLELGIGTRPRPREGGFSARRNRARWWFARMHEVVDGAREWQPAERGSIDLEQPEPLSAK